MGKPKRAEMPERELRINVGVIAERRKASSPWAEDYWVPVAVVEGESLLAEGDVVRQSDEATAFFLGTAEIYCHATEAEAYVFNFDSVTPAVYVVLRQNEDGPLPWRIHAVTVSPYEAQDYSDSAEDIVDRVQMPDGIAREVSEFIEKHYVETPFKKRKRRDFRHEEAQFGNEPIFLRPDRARPKGKFDA